MSAVVKLGSKMPADFETNGPHRLILKTRVRTTGLSESWELELPQMPLSFEFDPTLSVDALSTMADASRVVSTVVCCGTIGWSIAVSTMAAASWRRLASIPDAGGHSNAATSVVGASTCGTLG